MSEAAKPAQPPDEALAGSYSLFCLVALGVYLLTELQTFGLTTLLTVLVGLLGVLTRMRLGPPLFLLFFAAGKLVEQVQLGMQWQAPGWSFRLSELAAAAAVLGYVVCHCRLQALARNILPPDPRVAYGVPRFLPPRLLPPRETRTLEPRRSARLVTAEELTLVLLLLPAPAVLAGVCWMWLGRPWAILDLPPRLGRLILLVWVLVVGLLVVAAVLRHWRLRRMSVEEGTMLLQDVLWKETRREQRRINRWVAWGLLRRKRKERP
jgi:hypothetical protein